MSEDEVVALHVGGQAPQASGRFALWSMGFRPFFLLAGLSAVVLVVAWLGAYRGEMPAAGLVAHFDMIAWHYHEMLFGFAVAVIAGFLLTAGSNWTGRPTARGKSLMVLAGVWLAGRLAVAAGSVLPGWLIAVIDLAFLPALCIALALPVVATGNRRNYVFIGLLGLLTAANGVMHLPALGWTEITARTGGLLATYIILLMIVLIGGRVFPYFASKRLAKPKVYRYKPVEIASVVSLVALMIVELAAPAATGVLAALAGFAAVVHAVRWAGWHDRRVWAEPLLWVLYMGYGWLIVGLALRGFAALGKVVVFLPMHAYTVGAIGVLTLGMMARVALGHTGRALEPARTTTAAFVLINLATLVRVFGPIVWPGGYITLVSIAGVLWAIAFVLFLVIYTPICIRPRVDGKPG